MKSPYLEEHRNRGRVEGRAEDISRPLSRRFGNVPMDLAERVRGETDYDRLGVWFDAAVTVTSLDEFSALIG